MCPLILLKTAVTYFKLYWPLLIIPIYCSGIMPDRLENKDNLMCNRWTVVNLLNLDKCSELGYT